MKKLLFILTILAMFVSFSHADQEKQIRKFEFGDFVDASGKPWEGQTLGVGSEITWTKDFGTIKPVGFGALQITTAGAAGSVLIVHKSSCTGRSASSYNTTIRNGIAMDDIVSIQTAGSYQYQFDMPFSRYFEISLTNSGSETTIGETGFNLQ